MSATSTACATLRERCTFNSPSQETDRELVEATLTLDYKLECWASQLPPGWSNMTRQPLNPSNWPKWAREIISSPGAPEDMCIYADRLVASDWNMYRATRIRLNLTLLEFLSRCSPHFVDVPELRSRALDLVATLTSDIACSIPFLLLDGALQDTGPPENIPGVWTYMMLWPTYIGLCSLYQDEHKTEDRMLKAAWFKNILGFLRDYVGLAKVEVLLKNVPSIVS